MIKKILIFFLILLPIYAFAEILPYDSSVLFNEEQSWVEPFRYFDAGNIIEIKQNDVRINLGENLNIQSGFVYDIYHKNEVTGQLNIISVLEDESEGKLIAKKGTISNYDEIKFVGQINVFENQKYSKRYDKKLSGKITIVEENFCLININRKNGVEIGMKFSIINKEEEPIGVIEVVDTSFDKDSLCSISEKNKKIEIGYIVKKNPRSKEQWIELAVLWETQPETQFDAVYAYEKALDIDPSSNEIKNNFFKLLEKVSNEFIGNEIYDKALIYIKKIKKYNPKFDEKYKDLLNRTLDKGKTFWHTGNYIQAIRYFEQLEQSPETIKLLSDSYIEVGNEFEGQNNLKPAIYCYERANKLSPKNINYQKNLYTIYENNKMYDKAINVLKNLKDLNIDDQTKKWVNEQLDNILRVQEKRAPNYRFVDLGRTNFNLDSLQGYVVFTILWSTSFDGILEELRFLALFSEKFKNQPLRIIAINSDQRGAEVINQFITSNELKVNYTIAFTPDRIDFLFPTNVIPQIAIVDKRGKLVYHKIGKIDEREIEELFSRILNDN